MTILWSMPPITHRVIRSFTEAREGPPGPRSHQLNTVTGKSRQSSKYRSSPRITSYNVCYTKLLRNVRALRKFYEEQIEDAKKSGVLLSLHLKATMMKVSDPIMFGHAVSVYYKDVFEKHADVIRQLGANPNNGLGDLYAKIQKLPEEKRAEIEADIQAVYIV